MASTALPRLVLIHGLFSSPQEFALTAQTLRVRGVDFDFIEVPGYTMGDRRHVGIWQRWVDAASKALDAHYPAGTPIVLGGLCVGGAIAAKLAVAPRQQDVRGLALLSPSFDYDGWSLTPWRHLRRLGYWLRVDRWISVAEAEPYGIKNPKIRKWVVRELERDQISAVGPARLPLRALRESERLYAAVRSLLRGSSLPVLVLHAREDEITRIESVERLVDEIGPKARLVVLEHSYHMITVDNDRQRVAHELADFIGAPRTARVPEQVALRSRSHGRPGADRAMPRTEARLRA